MTINIICDNKMRTRDIKKKTNHFLGINNRKWLNQNYLYDHDIIYNLFDHGISLNSLCDSEGMYVFVCHYIEAVFSKRKIGVYGTYKWDKLSSLRGVTIIEI